MGLSKRQQKRLTRRRQKAQRKTNKRRNKNKRGGRKSRVKRQRKRGGMMGDAIPSGSQALQSPAQYGLTHLQPGNNRMPHPFSSLSTLYPGRLPQRPTTAKPPVVGATTISQTFFPYYDVFEVIDLVCIFVDDQWRSMEKDTERGRERNKMLTDLIDLYMTNEPNEDRTVQNIRDILSVLVKRIITIDKNHTRTPEADTIAVMSLIGVAIKSKFNDHTNLSDDNVLKTVFEFSINELALQGPIWSSKKDGGRVPDHLTLHIPNTIFFIKEFIGRRFMYSLKYKTILDAKKCVYNLIPPSVYNVANINQIVTNAGELTMNAIRYLQQSIDNFENSIFSIIFNPTSFLTLIRTGITNYFSEEEIRLRNELSDHGNENPIFLEIANAARQLCASLQPSETHYPATQEHIEQVQVGLKQRFEQLDYTNKRSLLQILKDLCKQRPSKESMQMIVDNIKEEAMHLKGPGRATTFESYRPIYKLTAAATSLPATSAQFASDAEQRASTSIQSSGLSGLPFIPRRRPVSIGADDTQQLHTLEQIRNQESLNNLDFTTTFNSPLQLHMPYQKKSRKK